MKTRRIQNVLQVCIIAGLLMSSGCAASTAASGETQTGQQQAVKSTFNPKDAIKIDDIDWKVESAVVNGLRCMSLNYTNNSEYRIMSVEIVCTLKDSVTADQMTVFNDMKESGGWTDDDMKHLTFSGENDKFTAPGESASDARCYIRHTFSENVTAKMYDLFEPSMMKIAFIGKDGLGYGLQYDFIGDAYGTTSKEGFSLTEWSDSDLASLLPKPEFDVVSISSDESDYLYVYVYGVKESGYQDYVQKCKDQGFDKNIHKYENSFSMENEDSINLSVYYDSEEERMSIIVTTK